MQIHLVLLEDDHIDGLYPFTVLHTPWELRCGALRFVDAWRELLQPASWTFSGRAAHIASFLARFPQYSNTTVQDNRNTVVVALSSALLPTQELARTLLARIQAAESGCLVVDGQVMGILCSSSDWQIMPQTLSFLRGAIDNKLAEILRGKEFTQQTPLIHNLWDCLDYIERSLTEHIPQDREPMNEHDARNAGVFVVAPQNIYIGEGCSIAPSVVMDASKGPIIIEANVTIMPHATLVGPCFIGEHSLIKIGAKIYPNTVIGEWCKAGGEIEHSIMHAFANKQHEGFLGHSYISEWVNLGADTNTSDLKNTYGNIKVRQRGKEVDSKRMFLGLLCGDHTKSGINTMFNTGTIAGIHANVFGAGYSPTEIPSYCWGAIQEQRVYALKMALSVARTVMQRRNQTLLPEEEALMRMEFERVSA